MALITAEAILVEHPMFCGDLLSLKDTSFATEARIWGLLRLSRKRGLVTIVVLSTRAMVTQITDPAVDLKVNFGKVW